MKHGTVVKSELLFGGFNWPSTARLPDGRIMAVCSGFRLAHVCPFGKVVACYSSDEGLTWSLPSVVLDTPLDDRDAGIAVSGERWKKHPCGASGAGQKGHVHDLDSKER